MLRRLLSLALPAALVLSACADDGTPGATATGDATPATTTTTTVAPASAGALVEGRPFTAVHEQRTYVDPSRSTRAYDVLPAAEERTLVTELWYPSDPPGPVPLIVFSHGLAGHPDKFAELLEAWATAGFAVAAPAFPLTSVGPTPGLVGSDVAEQPADVSFVLDQVLDEADGGELEGVVDPDRVAAAGLSLGGMTTYAVAFGDAFLDDRIDAVIIMSSTPDIPVGAPDLTRGLPLLVLHGTADPVFDLEPPRRAYAAAVAPKALVLLDGQGHFQPFEDAPSDVDEQVRQLTVAWWDRWLLDDAGAIERLTSVADGSPLLDLELDLG